MSEKFLKIPLNYRTLNTYFKINVLDNENEVLKFLHELNVFETGKILSPTKEVWFKFDHYIRFINVYHLLYTYTHKNVKYEGVRLQNLTFEELKRIFILRNIEKLKTLIKLNLKKTYKI